MSETINNIDSGFRPSVTLQKLLYLNAYFYPCWYLVTSLILYGKLHYLGRLNIFISIAVLLFSLVVESARIYCGYLGNLSNKVPELAGFLMLTTLMQMPLVTFFLLNIHLETTPTEVTVNIFFWTLMLSQAFLGYFALKRTSNYAKNLYLATSSPFEQKY